MKKILLNIVSIILILLTSEFAGAIENEPIPIRLKKQASRIQKGCDRGQLTTEEKKILKKEQEKIKQLIKQLSSDKVFSAEDKNKIHAALDKASIHIFKQRYNKKVKLK